MQLLLIPVQFHDLLAELPALIHLLSLPIPLRFRQYPQPLEFPSRKVGYLIHTRSNLFHPEACSSVIAATCSICMEMPLTDSASFPKTFSVSLNATLPSFIASAAASAEFPAFSDFSEVKRSFQQCFLRMFLIQSPRLYFCSNYRKPSSCFTSPCGLTSCIECKKVSLILQYQKSAGQFFPI